MSQAGKFSTSSGPVTPSVLTLTGNSGGPVGPDGGGNIDVVGDGSTVEVAGNAGTNTLTISVDDSVANQYSADSGFAVPVGNNLNIFGDSASIVTSATGDTVTIHYTPFIRTVNTTPYNAVAIDYYLAVDASGSPITINLPNTTTTGRMFIVKDYLGQANINNINVTTPGGTVLFDGFTLYTLNAQYQSANFIFDGTNYQIW
jgi:hypothetical protein